MADLSLLIELSRLYGGDPDWVLLGGGNTSLKEDGILYVKGSGFFLKDIDEKGFVAMDLKRLEVIWTKEYPVDPVRREAAVLEDILAARLPGQEARPSVEALFHSFIPGRYVVHNHPTMINGMTSGRDGEAAMEELFGGEALWVPSLEPGYVLAAEARKRLMAYVAARGRQPEYIFLQNHGFFAAGEDRDEIIAKHNYVRDKINAKINRRPETDYREPAGPDTQAFRQAAEKAYGGAYPFFAAAVNGDILSLAGDPEAFKAVALPFNPDQALYTGPCFCRLDSLADLPGAVEETRKRWNKDPLVFFIKGQGAFGLGATQAKANFCLDQIKDAVKISIYAEPFGGYRHISDHLINFILNWEAESYRTSVQPDK